MYYLFHMASPLGPLTLGSDGEALTGLWYDGQRYDRAGIKGDVEDLGNTSSDLFQEAERWLRTYFSGEIPSFMPAIHLSGTPFQKAVWTLLQAVPYGKTATYGEIAEALEHCHVSEGDCTRAVGNAISRNPISIIIPCHRIIASTGALTGYAGGIARKKALLAFEELNRQKDMGDASTPFPIMTSSGF
ncbi:MAG: methylated-DNA--[Clostridia bacterium]|nr:methylated-DNA--[protein]-cysteine S-methyltransferase [Clostridia bacterium]